MRKILSFAMVAMLLVAGCAKDVDSLNGGDTVAVTFSAKLPVEVSRTVGDGSQATVLKYAIYSTEGVLFDGYNYQDLTVQGNVATLTLDLVKGQSYKIVFWAQNAAAPYTFDRVAKTVTINYDDKELSNDEVYDAFYVMEPVTVKGPFQKQVTLRRPFAQINLGATKADVAAAKALGVEIDKSQVAFTDVPTVLNLVDGTLGEKTTNVNVTFNYNSLPGNDLTVNEVDYEYIAANYILADANTNVTNVTFAIKQGDKVINQDVTVPAVSYKRNYRTNILGRLLTSAVDFNIVIDGTPEGDLELSDEAKLYLAMQTEGEYTLQNDLTLSKPFEVEEGVNFTLDLNGKNITTTADATSGKHLYAFKNYGTMTIKGDGSISSRGIYNYGKLTLESGTIDACDADGGYAVNNEPGSEFVMNGGTVSTSNEDDNLGDQGGYDASPIDAPAGSKVVINAGAIINVSDFTSAIACSGGEVIINGGEITNIHTAILASNGGEVTINGGKIVCNGTPSWTVHTLYASTADAKIIVNGGEVSNTIPMDDQNATGASVINGNVVISGGTFTGRIEDYYGTPVISGGSFNVDPSAYVVAGYKALESNGMWVVVEDTVDAVVSTSAELADAIANGSENVVMSGDVEWNSKISNDATIDLNGKTFEATGTITLGNNADLTMVGGNYEVNGTYGHVDVRPTTAEGSVLTYKDVNFSFNKLNKTYGPSTNRLGTVVEVCPTVAGANVKILFEDCTFDNASVLFEGLSGIVGTFEAEFKNCTFNALTSSSPIEVQNYIKGSIKLVGCTFNLTCTSSSAAAVCVNSSSSTSMEITAENNTINAVVATPYTYDASKGETEVHNVKVNGTPKDIKFIDCYANTTVTETGTVKSGIAL